MHNAYRGLSRNRVLPPSKRRTEIETWLDQVLRPWFTGRVLPIDSVVAERCGFLAGESRLKGRVMSMGDALIAATALTHGLTVATRNVKHFEHLADLLVFNPWVAR